LAEARAFLQDHYRPENPLSRISGATPIKEGHPDILTTESISAKDGGKPTRELEMNFEMDNVVLVCYPAGASVLYNNCTTAPPLSLLLWLCTKLCTTLPNHLAQTIDSKRQVIN
jgi:hypothetical protein